MLCVGPRGLEYCLEMDEGRFQVAGTAVGIGGRRGNLLKLVGLVFVTVALGRPAAARAVGELSYEGCFGAASGCTFVAGGPLTKADSVAVSPNGGSVYVTGDPADGAVSHFFVGAQGRLAYDGCVSNDGSGGRCADVPGSGTPLSGGAGVAVSPNGASVYTANFGGTIVHFFADPSHGQLSYDGCVSNDGSGGTCLDVPGSGTPLRPRADVAVSPNGASVYAANAGGTLDHLFADPTGGQLSWDGCVSNDGSGGTCLDVPGSGTPLEEPFAVAVSPNGASLYAANAGGTLDHLFADPTGGQLSWDGCVSDDGSGGTCLDVPGSGTPLLNPTDVAVSPNGASVYAVSFDNGTVSHLFADPTGGQLSWDGCVSDDGSGGTCADVPGTGAPLAGARGVAVSPDGRSLYVASVYV